MRTDNNRPVVVDLFAGAGGLSLGFEQAGFDVAGAIELDPVHAATHAFNFPHCAVLPRSVAELTGAIIKEQCHLKGRGVDVLCGGPPCQGFSMIGQRALDDPRNALVRHFVRLVSELAPSVVLFENVKGLTVGKQKRFLSEIVHSLERLRYEVAMPWRVLDAAWYGVPQHRERLFLLAAKRGVRLPRYPLPVTQPADSDDFAFDLPKGPNCHDAIGDLPEVDDFSELLQGDTVAVQSWRGHSVYARLLHGDSPAVWEYGYRRTRWRRNLLTSSARTRHSAISRRRFAQTRPGQVEPISRFFKLAPDGLCNTLRAGTDAARGAFTSPRPIHYASPRCITVREMARLHGFPDWFRFHVTKWHGARQVGNSVPPPLARAIALEIGRALGHSPTIPGKTVPLGDPRLLSLDMASAAGHWKVRVPIKNRDRKSGARKRSQAEIERCLRRTVQRGAG